METNTVLDCLKTRRAIRTFLPDPVETEKLEAILEAGTYAPTGMGKQAPIIIAITDPEKREKIRKMNAAVMNKPDADPFYGAPVILIVLADKNVATYIYDGSLVMGNLMNAAHSLGVGSIWIHRAKQEFETEEGKAFLKELGIEGDYEGIGHCALGDSAKEPAAPSPRKENYIYRV